MCRSKTPEQQGRKCGCEFYDDKKTMGKEDLLAKLKRHKRKLESELEALDSKLKSDDEAGKGGEGSCRIQRKM